MISDQKENRETTRYTVCGDNGATQVYATHLAIKDGFLYFQARGGDAKIEYASVIIDPGCWSSVHAETCTLTPDIVLKSFSECYNLEWLDEMRRKIDDHLRTCGYKYQPESATQISQDVIRYVSIDEVHVIAAVLASHLEAVDQAMKTFAVGDVVRKSNSDSLPMTIEEIIGDKARTVWFRGEDGPLRGEFRLIDLTKTVAA